METMRIVRLGVIIFLCQELSCGFADESSCLPGFESELLVFKVHRDHLHRGKRLGRITFNTCDGRTRTLFQSVDKRFDVNMDGVLSLKRPVTLHEGHKVFSVHAWDSSGKKHTAFVRVERAHNHEEHHMDTEVNTTPQMESLSDFPVLTFPKSSSGLKRRKRGWVIPPFNEPENSKGPFPKKLAQIKSDYAKETRMVYSITGEGVDLDPKGLFTIEKLTGNLFVTQKLDREKKASYRLIVHAVAAEVDIKETPMEVIVHVIDQNDNNPVFTQNPFSGHVPEAAKKDFEFMKVTATDADEPDNDNSDVRYSIISQDPPSPKLKMFDINTVTGGIRVIETGLDREKYSRYTLVIRAADMAGEGRSTTGTAVITVTDSNNKAPQFEYSSGRKGGCIIPPFNEPENSKGPFPKKLVQIKSDYAKETRMVYSITGEGADLEPKGLFTIEKFSGNLFVTQKLDREKKASYRLVVHAVAAEVNIRETPMEVIVSVIDQNDNNPVFTQNPFSGHVPEAAKKDFEFMKVTATDADEPDNDNSDVRYSIISQDPPLPKLKMFDINTVTGGIRVIETGLDREKYSRYTLVIRAADMAGEGRSTTGTAVITVTDSNNKAPQFEYSSGRKGGCIIPPFNEPENSKGPFPKKLVQINSDFAKETRMVYSITGEGADLEPKGLFTIEKLTANLFVTQKLDREKKASYRLIVHAVAADDARLKEAPMEVIVNVIDQNDNSPVFTQNPFSGHVPEAAKKDFEFMKVTATDADEPDNDNSDVRYSIISQDPPLPKLKMFDINTVTGGIRVIETGLDREKYSRYTLVIRAADMAGEGRSTTGTAVITVTDSNNKAPQFEYSSSSFGLKRRNGGWIIPPFNEPENSKGPFPKKLVQIKSDYAKETRMVYSITGEGVDLEPKGLFTIDKFSGNLFVTQKLDREHKASYRLVVHAVAADDARLREAPMEVIVNVIDQNDNSPVFTQNPFSGHVPEAAKKDFEFMKVTATDADEPDNDNSDVRYTILSQDPPLPKPKMFDINTVTGGIRVIETGLDREKYSRYTLVIRAADMAGEGRSTTGTAVITVTDSNNKAPQFEYSSSSFGLKRRKRGWVIPDLNEPENSKGPFPKKLVQIKSDYAKETRMVYSITGEGADLDPKGLFTIDKFSGNLFVTQKLDREHKASYRLIAHSVAAEVDIKEVPMEVIVHVIDQNDNNPVFTQNPFSGHVPEAAPKDYEFMKVTATDADEPDNDNSDVRYSIISQDPPSPKPKMFDINTVTGGIRVIETGLDREKYSRYTLVIRAADMAGEGRSTTGTAVITVTDSNDNAPQFEYTTYTASVPENKVGAVVAKMSVTDDDEPGSAAWSTKYRIVDGDKNGFFNVSTGPSQLEGIITTAKPLDFEKTKQYILSVIVENDEPFVGSLPTSTATVTVNVEDVNEPPVFIPNEKVIFKPEDLPVDSELVTYTATDPDTGKSQKITYKIANDPAGWLNVNQETGVIKVRSPMDRESNFVKDDKYRAIILAIDNDEFPATGTATLIITLEDVNDNAPSINEGSIKTCNRDPVPVLLSITDKDAYPNSAPFSVETQGDTSKNWTAVMNGTATGIELRLSTPLEPGQYNVTLRVYDQQRLYQDHFVQASVCDCTGQDIHCSDVVKNALVPLSGVLGILAAILVLLLLLVLLLMFLRWKRGSKEEPLIPEDDLRDNIYYYDEEGGGEDDRDYDLSVLHRGLDNKPNVFRNDEAPTFLPAPQYRPRPANPEEIGTFIDDNLNAADNDPTAPPYDSLLVFDYEGGGSEASSLSSLHSSSSGADQDYDFLNDWGPRFKKLADMYGGED
ncbi:protocadherin Fat 1-like isoform X4 [Xyrauchen texanus]|uniref:protocadherin Fat 1-like isoform X4 n=1 Tax=Xyrauchen texanus TaxID=154827 RepID=UPI002241F254|nr:protocadherin Fat 1-like isoform X4 [Xyrauchen texanus]